MLLSSVVLRYCCRLFCGLLCCCHRLYRAIVVGCIVVGYDVVSCIVVGCVVVIGYIVLLLSVVLWLVMLLSVVLWFLVLLSSVVSCYCCLLYCGWL